jgi:hypothetical protein
MGIIDRGFARLSKLAASTGAGMVGFQQAGTGAVARTAESKMREVVSVKDFGAIGDGVANDTQAFDLARIAINDAGLAGGKTPPALFVPPGVYNIDRILITHSNFKLVCSPGALFKWRGGAGSTYPFFIYPDNLASSDFDDFYKNIEIDGLRIDPATVAPNKSVIRIGNAYAGMIRNCHFEDDFFGADNSKLALDFGDGSYKWAVENCTLPRIRCSATSAWNLTMIAFRSVGGRRLELRNALGISAHQLILEGNESSKISLESVNGFTVTGGDFEGSGTLFAFAGTGNTNVHSLGNDVTALTGSYSSGVTPTNSSFNDRGNLGVGAVNLNGEGGKFIVRRGGHGRISRFDDDSSGANFCIDSNGSGHVLIGSADDRLNRLVAGDITNASLSWENGKLGFFTDSPVVKPSGVPVTAAGIHAALVTLGLIS